MKQKVISLSLNEETNNILDEFSEKTKATKSEIIRKVLYFYKKHPEELKKVLIEEIGLEE